MESKKSIDRDGLAELGERTLEDMVAHPPKHPAKESWYSLATTSGSSGGRPIVISVEYPAYELQDAQWQNVVVSLGARNTRLLFVLRSLREEHVRRVLTVDGADLDEELGALMAEFGPDGMRGFSFLIGRIGERMSPETAKGVRRMELMGEKVTPVLAEFYAQQFPECDVRQLYGAAEIGLIAIQPCEFLARNCYHLIEGVTLEVDAPDESGVGDILISRTVFRKMRVERYRIGDVGRWEEKPCPCGRRYFEFVGRRGLDRIFVAGALLQREEFDRVAGLCGDLFDDYRAEAYQELEGGKLKGAISLTVFAGGRTDETLRGAIQKRFPEELRLTPTRTLSQLVADGLFVPLTVELAAGPLPRGSKDFKVRMRN